jgi:hypothetical protein
MEEAGTSDQQLDHIVVWWDGYNREHQSVGQIEGGFQREFEKNEAVRQAKKEIKKGAIRAAVWKLGDAPVMVAEFERMGNGGCTQTFPSRSFAR